MRSVCVMPILADRRSTLKPLGMLKNQSLPFDQIILVGSTVDDAVVAERTVCAYSAQFASRSRGTHALQAQRRIGKMMAIRFFELSDAGVPLQNVGICIRDYELEERSQ